MGVAAEQLKKEKNHPIMAAGLTFFSLSLSRPFFFRLPSILPQKKQRKAEGFLPRATVWDPFLPGEKVGSREIGQKMGGEGAEFTEVRTVPPSPAFLSY